MRIRVQRACPGDGLAEVIIGAAMERGAETVPAQGVSGALAGAVLNMEARVRADGDGS